MAFLVVNVGYFCLHFLVVIHALDLDVSPKLGVWKFSELDNGLGIDGVLLADDLDQPPESQRVLGQVHLDEVGVEFRLACNLMKSYGAICRHGLFCFYCQSTVQQQKMTICTPKGVTCT